MNIAIVLYDRFTALDAVGPYEVLSRLPGATVTFAAEKAGPVTTDNGMLQLVAGASLDQVPSPEIILIPGGPGEVGARAGGAVLRWLRQAHQRSTWTTSVCTGSLILAEAGLLDDVPATTHWLAMGELERLGARAMPERVVFDGKIVTAAGVSAGIDMGLALAQRIAGERVAQAIQLGIEYDPQPPLDAGSVERAPAELVEMLRASSRFGEQGPREASGVR
jgi:transcriptional regulator GlxA family with amidase domain